MYAPQTGNAKNPPLNRPSKYKPPGGLYLENCPPTQSIRVLSYKSVNFLNTKVIKDVQGNISTDVFQKRTDTHPYLHWTSAHPPHLKQSVPYGQALRLKEDMLINARTRAKNIGIFQLYSWRVGLKEIGHYLRCVTFCH